MGLKNKIHLFKITFFKRNSKYSFNEMKKKKRVEDAIRMIKKFQWKYKNSIAFILVLLLTFLLVKTKLFRDFIQSLGNLGYLGSLIAGLLYAYSFTIAFSLSVFYFLGKFLDPFILALLGALGAVVSDYLLFRFVKQNLSEEIRFLLQDIKFIYFKSSVFFKIFPFSNLILSERFENIARKVYTSKTFKILTTLIGYAIIASPLPDEIGITFLGMVKHRREEFIFLTFFLNFIGIFSFLILTQNL